MGIAADRLASFESICERERCPFAVVGYSSGGDQLRVEDTLLGNTSVDLPLSVLLGKPPKMERAFQRQARKVAAFSVAHCGLVEALDRVLHFPAVASKQFLITIGDRSITGQVACQQMIGPWQVPVADVAVTIRGYKTYRGEAMAMGERAPLAAINPAAAARMAVAESLTNLVAADIEGLDRVVLSANWMAAAGEDGEEQALYDSVVAVGEEFCPALGIAIPVGKDSLSMRTRWRTTSEERTVTSPVSLIVSAFAPVSDVRLTATPQISLMSDRSLVLLHFGRARMGGSALCQVYGELGDEAPDIDDPSVFRDWLEAVLRGKRAGLIGAMHDRSDGGLVTTLLEMAFAARAGLDIFLPDEADLLTYLFNEEIGIVVDVADGDLEALRATMPCDVTPVARIRLEDERIRICQGESELLSSDRGALQSSWSEVSYAMQRLRDEVASAEEEFAAISESRRENRGLHASVTFEVTDDVAAPLIGTGVRPRMAVLREQGVNGQIEMAAAFDRAGFDCRDVHMSDLVSGRVDLAEFSALVACGGFSYGDVLGGGGGWAKSILFNDEVRRMFETFFGRDTLSLGVCNGCQMFAQIKDLIPGADAWPKFVRNRSEQFEGRTVLTEILANDAPWLSGMTGSILPVAVAHGEGRAEFAKPENLAAVRAQGQIALRYVQANHEVAVRYPDNPNGADEGLAGLTAAEGKVLIMMPHPERVYRACQNVWSDSAWGEDGPWLRLFANARLALG